MDNKKFLQKYSAVGPLTVPETLPVQLWDSRTVCNAMGVRPEVIDTKHIVTCSNVAEFLPTDTQLKAMDG